MNPALAKQTRDPGRAAVRRTTRQIADIFLPRYRRAIKFALAAVGARATLGELTALAERGRAFLILQAFDMVRPRGIGDRPEHAKAEVLFRQLVEQSALENLEAMPSRLRGLGLRKQDAGLELGFQFDAVNPQVIEFLRRHQLAEIRGIDNKTRLGILAIITKAQTDGLPPAAQARLLKKLVGLTPKQIKMVANFRALLEGGERAAVFRSVLTRELRDHRFDATLISAIESGVKLPTARVDQMVDRFGERMLAFRANNIARTETIRAANAGQQLLWRQMANQGIFARQDVVRVWIVTPDDRLCPICEPIPSMNAGGVGLEQPFITPVGDILHPPAHPQCLPGDALVLASGVSATSERWFEGDLVVIRTTGGKQLRCTPNHPILTDRGWVKAQLINVGSHVVGGRLGQRIAGLDDDEGDDVPTRIHEITKAFRRSRGVASVEMPVTAPDFHGDGVGSEIAVVRAKGHLREGLNAALAQHLAQYLLVIRHEGIGVRCPAHGGSALGLEAAFDTSRGLVGGRHLALSLGPAHTGPLQFLGLALVPHGDTVFHEPSRQGLSGNAEDGLKLIDRLAGQVSFDQIVGIGRAPFRGHVYNLQTESGWYVANGIIAHNCRCDTALDTRE